VLIGAMNHPAQPLANEMEWMGAMGLGFIDLTLEPPQTASWKTDGREVRRLCEKFGLRVVGHTAFYLPLASAIKELRQAAVHELCRCINVFAEAGAKYMNVHPDRYTPMHSRHFSIEGNIESLGELIEHGKKYGVGVMVENLPGDYNNAGQLGELLNPLPDLGLHLDIGHANLLVPVNTTPEILSAFGDRLRHVHLHDNKGGHEDLHLPLGAGNIDVRRAVHALKECKYDGTITLEVFSPDRHYFQYSAEVLRRIWDEA
jgi:sugar phosphate isomerase/epimerase